MPLGVPGGSAWTPARGVAGVTRRRAARARDRRSAVPADPEDDVLPRRDAGPRVLVVVPVAAGAAEDDGVVLADVVLVHGGAEIGAPRAGGGVLDRQHRPHVVVLGGGVVPVAGQPGGGRRTEER